MNETVLKIAMAAFFHDIGKFAGREEMGLSLKNIAPGEQDLYLKKSYNNQYSHYHALYTAQFIELFKKWLPQELTWPDWGEGDIFTNLAGMHHKPESPMQLIITVADRLSSGWDRDTFEKAHATGTSVKDYKKTRLLPILEQLNFDPDKQPDAIDHYQYRYRLEPITPESIFPSPVENVTPADNEDAQAQYQILFNKFIDNLKQLSDLDKIELWFEHFDSLLMIYASNIPAARVGQVVPDVSLYDHCRTTAALAAAIYLYHLQTETFTEKDIQSQEDNKFLLISGDFSGIQNFIFNSAKDSQKFRAKTLRGRSLAISLQSELAADMLCQEIGLPSTSIVLNAAGKFTIIAPNTEPTRAAITTVRKKINDWLVKISLGETTINIATIEASCQDFIKGNMARLWDRLNLGLEEEKYAGFDMATYGGAVDNYLDGFVNRPEQSAVCPLCGKRPAVVSLQDQENVCRICRDHIFLGTNIVKKKRLAVHPAEPASNNSDNNLLEPIFGSYQITFGDKRPTGDINLLKYWNVGHTDITGSDVAVRFLKGYVPVYDQQDENDERIISSAKSESKKLENIEQVIPGEPKTLNHIACFTKEPDPDRNGKYRGIEALGVLKADVDNLGLLMACGLKKERFTISRLATLSRQINYYFAVYLPWFIENKGFKNIYTVFAGGDDLFLIGPWNSIIQFASEMRQSFASYVCNNRAITISAGISIHKPHTTIDMMADAAESLLETSKENPDNKNNLTVFSETVKWPEINGLQEVENIFSKWLQDGLISRVFFYRLNDFVAMAEKEKKVVTQNEIDMKDMACTKWRSLLSYSIERNIGRKKENRQAVAADVRTKLVEWLDTYQSHLRIPIWKLLYNRRQEG